MTIDPASMSSDPSDLSTRIVDDGMPVRAVGSLTAVAGAAWLSYAGGLHTAESAPAHAVRVYGDKIKYADTATTLIEWAHVEGIWTDVAIVNAAARPTTPTRSVDFNHPPILGDDSDWPAEEPSWWRDRDTSSPTSQAFARASAEGLVHAHAFHKSDAGYAFVVTTPNPERAWTMLEPAYGSSLALVESEARNHDGTAERLETLLELELQSKVLALGSLRGSDYQRYAHVLVDRITPSLIEAIAHFDHRALVVESIAEPVA